MYFNKCTKCGIEFETKNPKRVICPGCLYPDRNPISLESYADAIKPEAAASEEPENSNPQKEESSQFNPTNYNPDQNYNQNRRPYPDYNQDRRPPQSGGFQGGGFRGPQQGGFRGPQQGGFRPQGGGFQGGGFRGPQQGGGFRRPPQGGGFQGGGFRGPQQGGFRRPPQGGGFQGGGFRGPQQGGFRRPPQGGGFQGGGFRGPRRPPQKSLLISKEQLAQIELLYKKMLPLPNPDAHEVIGREIELEANKVFFGINLVRQKMRLPKLPYPKRKLAVTPDQLIAIENLYGPLLPVPPIGCHKFIAKQLKMDEWRVHVGIGIVRKQMSLPRWNPDREDAPEEFKNQAQNQPEQTEELTLKEE